MTGAEILELESYSQGRAQEQQKSQGKGRTESERATWELSSQGQEGRGQEQHVQEQDMEPKGMFVEEPTDCCSWWT